MTFAPERVARGGETGASIEAMMEEFWETVKDS